MSEKKKWSILRISITSDLHIYGGDGGLSNVVAEINFDNITDDFEENYTVHAWDGEDYDRTDDISFFPEEVKTMAKKILNMIHGRQFVPKGEWKLVIEE